MIPLFRNIKFLKSSFKNNNIEKQVRNLSLHEYASLSILGANGISVPRGSMFKSAQEAYEYANKTDFQDFVVKAQVLAGGRGKGHFTNGFLGGVHIVNSIEQVKHVAEKMINQRLVTKQTGPDGIPCNMVYVCERLYSRRDFYIAFALDRSCDGPVLVASAAGGVNIEETAQADPTSIHKHPINIKDGLKLEDAHKVLRKIGFTKEIIDKAANELIKLYQVFVARDMVLLEINPFCETIDGRVICMDCKVQVDDNALFRQPEIVKLRDISQENDLDVVAAQHNINYIKLDGDIGCMVNGAGLAMATMDILKHHGGSPANFLDIGGGSSVEQVIVAFKIILTDPSVKSIFVNIFGGIMRCDIIAEGIIEAAKTLAFKVPLVVRLRGTNAEEAMVLFQKSNLGIYFIEDFDEASRLAVQIAAIVKLADKSNVTVKFELPL